MIFKTTFQTGFCDINKDKKITNRAILKYLEECSGRHSDTVKNGVADIIDDGITWVLLSWNLKVLNRPSYNSELTVHTYISGTTKLYVYRDFEVYAGDTLVAVAESVWILVATKTMRPVRLSDDLIASYNPEYGRSAFDFPDTGLKESETYDKVIDYYIRKTDIDINDHVHNLNYLDMAYEIMPDIEPDNVIIVYKKEIKYKTDVLVSLKTTDNTYQIKVSSKENNQTNTLMLLW